MLIRSINQFCCISCNGTIMYGKVINGSSSGANFADSEERLK